MAYYLDFLGNDDYVGIAPIPVMSNFDIEFEFKTASTLGVALIGSNTPTRAILTNDHLAIIVRADGIVQVYNGSEQIISATTVNDGITHFVRYSVRNHTGGFSGTSELFIDEVKEGDTKSFRGAALNDSNVVFIGRTVSLEGAINGLGLNLKKCIITDFDTATNTRDYNSSSSNGTGSILPDDANNNDGTLVNFPIDDSQWVFYTPPVLGSHYLTFDGVNDWIRMTNFTMPASGIFSYRVKVELLSPEVDSGSIIAFGSYSRFLIIYRADQNQIVLNPLIFGGASTFITVPTDISGIITSRFDIDFDLNELKLYINDVLVYANSAYDWALAFSGQTTSQHDFGNFFNIRFLPCNLYEINVNNQLLYKNDESNELTYFPEIIQGAHATMFNFTLPDAWVFYSSGVQITGAFNMPFLSVIGNGSVTLPQPIANCEFEMPFFGVDGNISVTLPQPIIDGAFSMPFLGVNGSVQIGEITFTIERGTNINQKYLSANINQKHLSNTIIYN